MPLSRPPCLEIAAGPRTLRLTDPGEALVVGQALAPARRLRDTCQAAPHGRVPARAEPGAVAGGRGRTRRAPEAVPNRAQSPAERKGLPGGPAPGGRCG